MEGLPVWRLALIILVPLAVVFVARFPLQSRIVESADILHRSSRQFWLDFVLFILAGIAMAAELKFIDGFPVLQSGAKLAVGMVAIGFFFALDAGLHVERVVIAEAKRNEGLIAPPKKYYPLTRRFVFVAICTLVLVTLVLLLLVAQDIYWLSHQNAQGQALFELGRSIVLEIIFVMGLLLFMVLNLVFSYAKNLKILLDSQKDVLDLVSRGDLSRKAVVATNDELGVIAGHTNVMINGLRELLYVRRGLEIASEIQRNFLPAAPPESDWLRMAGTSLYSDETGGDFHDFVTCEQEACGNITIMIGDAVGHGVESALLMASARAMLRQSAAQPGNVGEMMTRANRHFSDDTEGTGRFVTVFMLLVNQTTREAWWTNAGHPPALCYDPETDSFENLGSGSLPLGTDRDWEYEAHALGELKPGRIILTYSDGLTEARNRAGEQFGVERIREAIRSAKENDAQEILHAVLAAYRKFAAGSLPDDDVTLVVVRAK